MIAPRVDAKILVKSPRLPLHIQLLDLRHTLAQVDFMGKAQKSMDYYP